MERIPNITVSIRQKYAPLISVIIYVALFFFILFSAEYIFIQKKLLRNINPITKMQAQYSDKQYLDVINSGAKLLKKHPGSLIVRRYLWKSYLYTKQFDKTIETIKEMEAIANNKIEVFLAYCTTFRIMRQYDNMSYYCAKALEIKPSNEIAHEQIIQSFIDQRQYDKAISYLNGLSLKQPDDLKKTLLRATIASLKGELPKAIEVLEQARKNYPDVPIVYYYLGENYFMMADYVKAASFLEEFTDTVYKKDIDVEILQTAYNNLALSYEKSGMYSNAYRAYKSAACFSIKMEKPTEAVHFINKAIASTYAGYTGFVSQNKFKDKFKELEDELSASCGHRHSSNGG